MQRAAEQRAASEKQWTFVDRAKWPSGPWDGEPDKVQWVDEATGLDCLMHRGGGGALCGYVGLPPGHALHGKSYDDVCTSENDYGPDVHGGLTFADKCDDAPSENGRGICHIPAPGRPADVWWLGFDCAHSGDFCPAYDRLGEHGTYRDIGYVRHQVEKLAAQLVGAV